MFLLRAGCKVPFPEKLSEEYMLIEKPDYRKHIGG